MAKRTAVYLAFTIDEENLMEALKEWDSLRAFDVSNDFLHSVISLGEGQTHVDIFPTELLEVMLRASKTKERPVGGSGG